MATKSITVDLEAYQRLKKAKRPNESFSQTIKRVVKAPPDLDALMREAGAHAFGDDMVSAVEQIVARAAVARVAGSEMAVLDTSTLIDLYRRRGTPERRRGWQAVRTCLAAGDAIATTRINLAELYAGVALADDPATEEAKVDLSVRWLSILEFDDRAARAYGMLYANLRRAGRLPGDMDLLIGSIALANGHSVLTRNAKHFVDMPGLTVHAY